MSFHRTERLKRSEFTEVEKWEGGKGRRTREVTKGHACEDCSSALFLEADCTWDVVNGIPAARFEEGRRKEARKVHA